MIDHDELLTAALDHLVPRSDDRGDWERVLREATRMTSGEAPRRARHGPSRRRILAVVIAAVLATLIAVPAVALIDWPLRDRSAPRPSGDIVVVESGRSGSSIWELTAYTTDGNGVCLTLTIDPRTTREIATQNCGPVAREAPTGQVHLHSVGLARANVGRDDLPPFAFGHTVAAIERVDIVLADGERVEVETTPPPSELPVPLRFFAVALPSDAPVELVVARERGGGVHERFAPPHGAR